MPIQNITEMLLNLHQSGPSTTLGVLTYAQYNGFNSVKRIRVRQRYSAAKKAPLL